jgi:hypothetical protein
MFDSNLDLKWEERANGPGQLYTFPALRPDIKYGIICLRIGRIQCLVCLIMLQYGNVVEGQTQDEGGCEIWSGRNFP